MWKKLSVLYADEFRMGSPFHCKGSLCCASRTFASQRGASHIFRALLIIATRNCSLVSVNDSVRGLISRMHFFIESNSCILRRLSGVFFTNYHIVVSVDGLCTRTLYKWEKSIAHCVDDFTSEKSQLQVNTFQSEKSLQELVVLRVEKSHKYSMVIWVADWRSANTVSTIFCFYNIISGQKIRN